MAKKRKNELDRAAVFGAILGEIETGVETQAATGVGLSDLRYNDSQPRKHFDNAALSDLAESIRERGVLEPIIVRRVGTGYEVVAGERRARAARMAGLSEVPAVIVELDDREALEIAITENLQREDLNAVEETEAVLGLLELVLEAPRADVVALLQALYGEERGRGGSAPCRSTARAARRRLASSGGWGGSACPRSSATGCPSWSSLPSCSMPSEAGSWPSPKRKPSRAWRTAARSDSCLPRRWGRTCRSARSGDGSRSCVRGTAGL